MARRVPFAYESTRVLLLAAFVAVCPVAGFAHAPPTPAEAQRAAGSRAGSSTPQSASESQEPASGAPADRAALEANGGPLWHALLKALRPQVVALSVARDHLSRIEFAPITEWETIHVFKKKDSGAPRSQPYEIRARWYEVDGERSLFVFGPAAQTPFGFLSDTQKPEAGAIALEAYNGGR